MSLGCTGPSVSPPKKPTSATTRHVAAINSSSRRLKLLPRPSPRFGLKKSGSRLRMRVLIATFALSLAEFFSVMPAPCICGHTRAQHFHREDDTSCKVCPKVALHQLAICMKYRQKIDAEPDVRFPPLRLVPDLPEIRGTAYDGIECKCGHPRSAHEHHRRGTNCSLCLCDLFLPKRL